MAPENSSDINSSAKVVVLGGEGFLGSHVLSQLEKKKISAVSLSRRTGCDMRSLSELRDRLKEIQPTAIINCAAHVGSVHYAIEFAADMIHDNILIVTNLYSAVLEACPQCKIINPISNCSYPGEANTHYEPDWQEGAVHESVLGYASSRRLIYALAKSYHMQHGTKSVNWLVANAYGPGDYTDPNKVHALNGIIIRLIEAKRAADSTFEIWGTGKPLREWVYIEDAARMLVASLDSAEQIYPLNLAQNKAYSIKEISEIAAKALNYEVEFVFNTDKPDGAMIKILDDRLFKEAHPEFEFTKLQDGISNTIQYYEGAL